MRNQKDLCCQNAICPFLSRSHFILQHLNAWKKDQYAGLGPVTSGSWYTAQTEILFISVYPIVYTLKHFLLSYQSLQHYFSVFQHYFQWRSRPHIGIKSLLATDLFLATSVKSGVIWGLQMEEQQSRRSHLPYFFLKNKKKTPQA